ncbi:hypothetical protein HDV00_008619 [Rhizophlyctis rosea]|nr:hypothetical protein HDV00_008619 [Rhizophlyctis rosea]
MSEIPDQQFKHVTGFVAQHDAPYWDLTPREALLYNAMMQLSKGMSRAAITERINTVLRDLNLLDCADVVMRRPEENRGGISGGQMRRLSIGVALLRRPGVLFLDEPTSGLDAKCSLGVMQILSGLAASDIGVSSWTQVVCGATRSMYQALYGFEESLGVTVERIV